MAKLRGLGKGLDVLFSASNIENTSDKSSPFKEIALSQIKPGKYQPRQNFDEVKLNELAQSISEKGVIQPIMVRPVGDKGFEIIAGERRFRASKIAGLSHIPAVIRDLTDEEALAVALIENIQRKDLNIMEESKGYKRLIDEFNLTHEELAKVTSRSRSHITNILRLLNLNPDVQDMLINGQIDMGHARALLPLPLKQQLNLALQVIDQGLTTAEVERRVSKLLSFEEEIPATP